MLGIFAILFVGMIIGYGLAMLLRCASTYSRENEGESYSKDNKVE